MSKQTVAPEFTMARNFTSRYAVLDEDALDVLTVWMMGTWCFSPMATQPATYPYLYLAGAKGSGKTVIGQDIASYVCRNHQATVGITGPGVFRMIGQVDEETNEVINIAPTLSLDEIDATYSGAKDEPLRQMLNAGYKRGATVPRAAGKTTINYPVFCPKILMGIDNGHLPDTVVDRSIRIDVKRATPEQMATIEPLYVFDVEDESLEMQADLHDWAVANSLVLRDYRPEPIPGLQPRQWEIARSLVQLAHAIGNEPRIREALHTLLTVDRGGRGNGREAMYRNLHTQFTDSGLDRMTSRQLLDGLLADGIHVPGDSLKGLAVALGADGIQAKPIRLQPNHPGIPSEGKDVQRGYFRHQFDHMFEKFSKSE